MNEGHRQASRAVFIKKAKSRHLQDLRAILKNVFHHVLHFVIVDASTGQFDHFTFIWRWVRNLGAGWPLVHPRHDAIVTIKECPELAPLDRPQFRDRTRNGSSRRAKLLWCLPTRAIAMQAGPLAGAPHGARGTKWHPQRRVYAYALAPARTLRMPDFDGKYAGMSMGSCHIYHGHTPTKHCRAYVFIRRTERGDAAVARSPVK